MWEGVGDRTELQYIDPPLLWPSALCLSRSPGLLNQRPRGSAFCWLSLPHLVTNGSPNSIRGLEGPFCWVVAFSTPSSPTHLIPNSLGGPECPFCRGDGFLYHILSPTHLISNSLGVPRAPSAGWWLSLPHLVSDSLISNSLTSCLHRVI